MVLNYPDPFAFTVQCCNVRFSVPGPEEFDAYTEDPNDLVDRKHLSHHLYADDTQLTDGVGIVETSVTIEPPQQCVEEVHRWCASRRLQLNPNKTEMIWFGTPAYLRKIRAWIGCTDTIEPASVIRDLGVLWDQELFMKQHINKVTSNCFPANVANPPHTRSRNHSQSRHCIRLEPSRLLCDHVTHLFNKVPI